MKNEQNNPFRIQCDIWLARIGSAFAWFWLVIWVLIGMVGLGDLMNGKSAETVDKVMPFVSFGFAAANVPLLLASRKTKRLIKDFRLYCPVLAHEPDKSISQLAAALNKPLEEVKGQLTEMCRRGYFNGYLDHQKQRLVFVQAQMESQIHILYCPGCGAKNAIRKTGDCCRYCGAPLTL